MYQDEDDTQPLTVTYPVLRYFVYNHLPDGPLKDMSRSFSGWAVHVASKNIEYHPETEKALHRLLEAKDAAVRSVLP